MSQPSKSPAAEIAEWHAELARCVDGVQYGRAKALFHPDVVNFSTASTMLHGVDELRERQWRRVWHTIEDFRFDMDQIVSAASADGAIAWGIAIWHSTGIDKDGKKFERPGRATTTYARDAKTGRLVATHIHFSLFPGTPEKSFGKKPEHF